MVRNAPKPRSGLLLPAGIAIVQGGKASGVPNPRSWGRVPTSARLTFGLDGIYIVLERQGLVVAPKLRGNTRLRVKCAQMSEELEAACEKARYVTQMGEAPPRSHLPQRAIVVTAPTRCRAIAIPRRRCLSELHSGAATESGNL